MSIRIAPSILSADFARLGEQIRMVEDAGAHLLHVDVMDGHFVPNITIGPPVVRSIREATKLPLDVHLMISNPDQYIPAFVKAGANLITVHAEATIHLDRTLNLIRSANLGVGVAINPATPLSVVEHVLPLVDVLLIMSVNPGFGGQEFISYALEKILRARHIIDDKNYSCAVEVDGGIDTSNIAAIVKAGAGILVAGAAIFRSPDPARKVKEMLETAASVGYHSKYV